MQVLFMLTKNDVTIQDALQTYRLATENFTAEELPYAGFKYAGVSEEELLELALAIKADGRQVVLEMVGSSLELEPKIAQFALKAKVDFVIGGTHAKEVSDVLKGSSIRYFPAVGDVNKEAGRVHGSIDELIAQAQSFEELEVEGIMLLAYRYAGDVGELLDKFPKGTKLSVMCAGSIETKEQIETMNEAGVWGYTIGSAVLDKKITAQPTLEAQIRKILAITPV